MHHHPYRGSRFWAAWILVGLTYLGAADASTATAFTASLQGDDAAAKRAAMVQATGGSDADAIPLLILGVADRQTHDQAIQALRARTGLKPIRYNRGSGYPGYPTSDDPAAWQAWFTQWSKNQKRQQDIDGALAKLQQQTSIAAPVAMSDMPPAVEPVNAPPAQQIPTDNLGRLDRIVYRSGRTLLAFQRSVRLDGDGHLMSIRVVHRDGSGEETIDGRLIARVDQDVDEAGR